MVAVIEPLGELRVELIKAVVGTDQRQHLGAYGPETALDFTLALWRVRGSEDQRYAQRCARIAESLGAERGAVIDIQFAWQTARFERSQQAILEAIDVFTQVEAGAGA